MFSGDYKKSTRALNKSHKQWAIFQKFLVTFENSVTAGIEIFWSQNFISHQWKKEDLPDVNKIRRDMRIKRL